MRLLGRNATTLPGKAALRLYRDLPGYLTCGQNVTLITGTNGKTTTTRMLCSIYEALGFRVITNVSGANLASGVVTSLIEGLSFSDISNARKRDTGSKKSEDRAKRENAVTSEPANKNKIVETDKKAVRIVLEIDEAAFGRYAASLHPGVIAVTNLFRDQLDRYGELSKTRELIRKGIQESDKATVLLCADDSLCASLAYKADCALTDRVVFCGIEKTSMSENISNQSATTEAGNCVFCGSTYRYSHRSFGHLGFYQCPGCGFSRPDTSFHCDYEMLGNNRYRASFGWGDNIEAIKAVLPVPGEHNVYNAMTAIAAACLNGVSLQDTRQGILNTKAGFGRMERFRIRDREACIVLVKNPVGLERALDFLANATDAGSVLILLNDGIADGTDVSWIWDVDFESKKFPRRSFVSGTRCYDMALRLQYAGVPKERITVSHDFAALFGKALAGCEPGECLYVLPNYTSLLELRAYLSTEYHLKEIWK